ncbi:hypothetical protein FB639_002435, partial [Coemansia asiatica]
EFDPATIPLCKWEDYEQEILYSHADRAHPDDARSEMSSRASMYYGGHPRPASAAGSVYGANNYGYYPHGAANMQLATNPHVNIAMSMAGGADVPCSASVAGMSIAATNQRFMHDMSAPMQVPMHMQMQIPAMGHAPLPPLSGMPGSGGFQMASMSHTSSESAPIQYPSGMPNEVVMQSVRRILSTADLMMVTKKQVRQQVGQDCNMDQDELNARKSFINLCIDEALNERL